MARDIAAGVVSLLILPLLAVIWVFMILGGAVLALLEWIFDDER